ncbi:MAG: 3,4-dihydroxy-2-butanone-4-phosphate synthase [Candidatus Micrarchaeia archaeon]
MHRCLRTRGDSTTIEKAIEDLRNGKPILIYDSDGREKETDIVVASQFVTGNIIRMMRKDGGGLICETLEYEKANALGLDYLVNIFKNSHMNVFNLLEPNDIPYDEKSSFSITINHRRTFTGIPDNDRALTIKEFAALLEVLATSNAAALEMLRKEFRSPGHVFLLIAAKGLLRERRGHTELSTFIVKEAGLIPSATIVEMLDDSGTSLPKDKAMKYATDNGLVFLEGKEIIERFLRS